MRQFLLQERRNPRNVRSGGCSSGHRGRRHDNFGWKRRVLGAEEVGIVQPEVLCKLDAWMTAHEASYSAGIKIDTNDPVLGA